jgi:hypothetical protein
LGGATRTGGRDGLGWRKKKRGRGTGGPAWAKRPSGVGPRKRSMGHKEYAGQNVNGL